MLIYNPGPDNLSNVHSLLFGIINYSQLCTLIRLWVNSLMIVNEIKLQKYQFKIDF